MDFRWVRKKDAVTTGWEKFGAARWRYAILMDQTVSFSYSYCGSATMWNLNSKGSSTHRKLVNNIGSFGPAWVATGKCSDFYAQIVRGSIHGHRESIQFTGTRAALTR